MTPAEMRGANVKLAFQIERASGADHIDRIIQNHQAIMLTEIAAQLAELNQRLDSVITDGCRGVECEVAVLSRRSS
jgi:hypothetical protein